MTCCCLCLNHLCCISEEQYLCQIVICVVMIHTLLSYIVMQHSLTDMHVCQDIPISYTFHVSDDFCTILVQFHFIHSPCRIHHHYDYYYHHSRHRHFTIFYFSCLISSLLLQIGWTALHLASGNGKLETVRTLVELGVDKEAKTDKVRNLMMMMMMIMAQTIVNNNDYIV